MTCTILLGILCGKYYHGGKDGCLLRTLSASGSWTPENKAKGNIFRVYEV